MPQMSLTDQRSYISADNLRRALAELHLSDYHHVIVWREDGRCTAIFAFRQAPEFDVMRPAHLGFMVFG